MRTTLYAVFRIIALYLYYFYPRSENSWSYLPGPSPKLLGQRAQHRQRRRRGRGRRGRGLSVKSVNEVDVERDRATPAKACHKDKRKVGV
jgi:hypothetical protein